MLTREYVLRRSFEELTGFLVRCSALILNMIFANSSTIPTFTQVPSLSKPLNGPLQRILSKVIFIEQSPQLCECLPVFRIMTFKLLRPWNLAIPEIYLELKKFYQKDFQLQRKV